MNEGTEYCPMLTDATECAESYLFSLGAKECIVNSLACLHPEARIGVANLFTAIVPFSLSLSQNLFGTKSFRNGLSSSSCIQVY